MVELLHVVLVDAERIDPKHANAFPRTSKPEHLPAVPIDGVLLSAELEMSSARDGHVRPQAMH